MSTVEEIKVIIKEQESKMQEMLESERIVEREYQIDPKQIASGAANIITGPRRCGKSVLAFELAKREKFGYINFDDERLNLQADELNKVLEAIYELNGDVRLLLFDEIQEVKGWEKFISRLVDSKRIIITGSNARMLSKEFATYLTGRHISHVLLPFSFREFLAYNEPGLEAKKVYTTLEKARVLGLLNRYLEVGGFPLSLKLGRAFLADLYRDIVERDVVQRYRIRMPSKLSDVARYLISNSSSEMSYNKLKRLFGIASKHTIQDWIGYLENAYAVFKLERFSYKLKESIMAPKKVYAIDTGMINVVSAQTDIDKLMESSVAAELLRRKLYWFNDTEINYWKSHAQEEVDFVVRKGRRVLQLIQVTYASDRTQIKERETRNLIKASKELKCKDLLVITWDYEGTSRVGSKAIRFMPMWKWMLSPRHY